MSSHKTIGIYMGALILGIIRFCFLKLFLIVGKELMKDLFLVTSHTMPSIVTP